MKNQKRTETLRCFRMIRILRYLRDGCTTQRLADLLQENRRSIQRDIQALKDECFPIVQERRGGPYRYDCKTFEIGQTLTLAEVLAVALGIAAVAEEMGPAAGMAQEKLGAFVKLERLGPLRMVASRLTWERDDRGKGWLPLLLSAIGERRVVTFDYRGEARTVEPGRLLSVRERWYLRGFDRARQARRTFRLVRMERLEAQEETFPAGRPEEALDGLFHPWDFGEGPATTVRCRVAGGLRSWLAENPVHPSQVVTETGLQFSARNLEAVCDWALGLRGLTVLEPADLRQRIGQRAGALASDYLTPPD